MKITVGQLRRIIKEEVSKALNESVLDSFKGVGRNEFGQYTRDGEPLGPSELDTFASPGSLAMIAQAVIPAIEAAEAGGGPADPEAVTAGVKVPPGVIPSTFYRNIKGIVDELIGLDPAGRRDRVAALNSKEAELQPRRRRRSRQDDEYGDTPGSEARKYNKATRMQGRPMAGPAAAGPYTTLGRGDTWKP